MKDKLTYKTIIERINNGNLTPDYKVIKKKSEWKKILSDNIFKVTREGMTEPYSDKPDDLSKDKNYACICCNSLLFDGKEIFNSGSGFPSFKKPIFANSVAYFKDNERVEARCNVCDAHLGHVFSDGPEPNGLRYCINKIALLEVSSAIFGGGCFWCTEEIFSNLDGVIKVISGYMGGKLKDPDYNVVCIGASGHAEVIKILYDSKKISYEMLLLVHFQTHDPTTLNKQGADEGTQYRSVIFPENKEQKQIASEMIRLLSDKFKKPITTTIEEGAIFYKAEYYHQAYYKNNKEQPYCKLVIDPKLERLKNKFSDLIKKTN